MRKHNGGLADWRRREIYGSPREASRSLASFLCSEAECTKCVVQMPFDVLRGVERGTAWYR